MRRPAGGSGVAFQTRYDVLVYTLPAYTYLCEAASVMTPAFSGQSTSGNRPGRGIGDGVVAANKRIAMARASALRFPACRCNWPACCWAPVIFDGA